MVVMFAHLDSAKRAEFVRVARPLALDRNQLGLRVADALWTSYDVALQQHIVEASILLNAGLNYNGLYHHMYNHL